MSEHVVVGIDAGGTSTRCLIVDLAGGAVSRARGPGANLNSSGDTEQALRAVLADALVPGRAIDALVFAAAGAGPAGAGRAHGIVSAALTGHSVGQVVVRTDIEAAFAAGSVDPDGTVVIAGTGTVAARVRDFLVARRLGGHGYLVGDRGSAFWIGARGATAVLDALDGLGPPTALVEPLLALAHEDATAAGRDEAELGGADLVQALVYSHPPAQLGMIAPLVESGAMTGDAVCVRIVEDAVSAIAALARHAHAGGAVVATGGLVTGSGLLGTSLRAALAGIAGNELQIVADGSVGAAALALRLVGAPPEAVARLVAPRPHDRGV